MRILGIVDVDIDKPRHKEAAAEIARRSARACLVNCSLIAAGRDAPFIDQQASVGESVERVRLAEMDFPACGRWERYRLASYARGCHESFC